MGDGNLFRKDYHSKLTLTGHLIDEREFYLNKIIPLVKKLFGNTPTIKESKRDTTIQAILNSKGVVSFLNQKIGLLVGPKTNQKIPKELTKNFKVSFLKGMADTEFCLTFKKRHKKKHYYPCISYGTTNQQMIKQIYNLLLEIGIKSSLSLSIVTNRNGKTLLGNEIDIYGVEKLNEWMKIIGFRSSKHLTKLAIWKRYEYCPPKTNLIERRAILKGETPIENFYK